MSAGRFLCVRILCEVVLVTLPLHASFTPMNNLAAGCHTIRLPTPQEASGNSNKQAASCLGKRQSQRQASANPVKIFACSCIWAPDLTADESTLWLQLLLLRHHHRRRPTPASPRWDEHVEHRLAITLRLNHTPTGGVLGQPVIVKAVRVSAQLAFNTTVLSSLRQDNASTVCWQPLSSGCCSLKAQTRPRPPT